VLSKTEAIVLRRISHGNTSRVVILYSRRYGQLRLLAKGARSRSRSRAGSLGPELFAGGEVVFYPRRSDALGILSEWCELTSHAGIAAEPRRYFAACYAAEAAEGLTREGEPDGELYALLEATFLAIERGKAVGAVLSAFESGLLERIGLSPRLDRCVLCDRTGEGVSGGGTPVLFSPVDGGLVCKQCSPRATGATVSLTGAAVKAMRHLARIGPQKAGSVELPRAEANSIREALASSVAAALERRPLTFSYAKALENADLAV
jgi:DNA repair protein RecO (recombination protein O)